MVARIARASANARNEEARRPNIIDRELSACESAAEIDTSSPASARDFRREPTATTVSTRRRWTRKSESIAVYIMYTKLATPVIVAMPMQIARAADHQYRAVRSPATRPSSTARPTTYGTNCWQPRNANETRVLVRSIRHWDRNSQPMTATAGFGCGRGPPGSRGGEKRAIR